MPPSAVERPTPPGPQADGEFGGVDVEPGAVEPGDVEPSGKTDGRQLRRQRNRETVVDALLDLFRDGNLRPSTEEIASRSGLSPRSLFRYFDDVDDLTRTAISRIEGRAVTLVPIAAVPADDPTVKAMALVDQRFRLFDAVGNVAAVSRLRSPFQPILATRLKENRLFLRRQLEILFAPELDGMDPEVAGQALAAVDVVSSFESYSLLLKDQEVPTPQARAGMARAIVALLGAS